MTIFSAALLLFLVMDPFGNVPVFLSVLRPVKQERRRWVIARELLIALGFLVVFLVGGQYLLAAIGISESSVTVAGGHHPVSDCPPHGVSVARWRVCGGCGAGT